VVVFDRRSVSVLNPTQSISAMQAVRRIKLIPVRTYERPLTKTKFQNTALLYVLQIVSPTAASTG